MNSYNTRLRDLKVAHEELLLNRQDLEKCAAELRIANENLYNGEAEQVQRTATLNIDLESMMFAISHKVRKSVANIVGISKIISDDKEIKVDELRELLHIIILSAESLNSSTEELTKFIHDKRTT